MALSITPAKLPYDLLYRAVIANITPGTQFFKTAPSDTQAYVVPYTDGKTSSFILEATIGSAVNISVNNSKVQYLGVTQNFTEILLQLVPGRNFILVNDGSDEKLIQVAATNYATFLRAWTSQFYNNCLVKLEDSELQLNSSLSLRATEHQLLFQELLPPTRTLRILAGKMAVRSLISETGTTRGVNDIATAITNTTPLVIPTTVNLEKYEPSVYTLYDSAHDFGGFEFNVWIPNTVAAGWAAFLKLANNLDDDIIKLTAVSDLKVSFEYQGIPETHIFDFDAPDTDIVGIVTRLLDCFYAVHVGVNLAMVANFAFCAWSPVGSKQVDRLLGLNTLDTGATLDSGSTLDVIDPADPYDNEGWLETNLSPPLDSGLSLDTVLEVSLFEDLECMYDPYTLVLGSSLLDQTLNVNTSLNVNLSVDNNSFGWIIGQHQLNVGDYLS
jgi:hypothetical protein